MRKIEETNCVVYGEGHFNIARDELAGLRELIETTPEATAREKNGYLFQVVFHLQEGNHELYTFLDSNHNTELEQSFKAELSILSGAVDGYLTWMSEEFIPGIMKDDLWERLQLGNLQSFDDGKDGIFKIEDNLNKLIEVLGKIRKLPDRNLPD